jgi:hypothetical protein
VENELLDGVLNKLDNLDGIGRMIGSETDDQNRIIAGITTKITNADQRLITNSNRVRNI